MKKVVVFLVLFGAALLALRYFEGEREPEAPTQEGAPEPGVAAGDEQPDPGEADAIGGGAAGDGGTTAPEAGAEGGQQAGTDLPGGEESARPAGLRIEGPFRARLFQRGVDQAVRALVLLVESADSRTERAAAPPDLPGAGELRDVLLDATAEVYDPDADDPTATQARLEAASISFPRAADLDEDDPDAPALDPGWVRVGTLDDVDVTLLAGAPFVPLTFTAPEATLDARDQTARTLRAPGPIVVEAEELQADGRELTVSLDQAQFAFEREATVRFRREGGEELTLQSDGTLIVRRRTDLAEADLVEVEATSGARLTLRGETDSTLTARTIRARGRERDAGDGEFLLEWFEADGEVVWQAGETEARGARARLDFDAAGELAAWRLEGDPSLRIEVEDLQGAEREDLPARGFVRVSGVGPLTGETGDVRTFAMGGPALIEALDADGDGLPHTTLRAAGEVRGRATASPDDPDALASTELFAGGGVRLESREGTLETEALWVDLEHDPTREEDVYRVRTRGSARFDGVFTSERLDSEELDLTLLTEGPLRASRRGGTWRVDEGEDVTLAVEPVRLDEDPSLAEHVLRAEAGRVTAFDPDAGDLLADGGVTVQGGLGAGRGARIAVRGGTHYELIGSIDDPARFQSSEGEVQALYLLREGTHTEALGLVVTRFERVGGADFPDQEYEIRADRLVADQRREEGADGSERRTFELDARGAATSAEVEALAADLRAVGALAGEADAPVLGRVDGRVGFGEESSTIRCEHLTALRVETWEQQEDGEREPAHARTTLSATGAIEGELSLEGSEVDLACESLDLMREEALGPESPEDAPFSLIVDAGGGVTFHVLDVRSGEQVRVSGSGERLQLDQSLTGELSPAAGERVQLEGSLPGQEAPYELDAARIEFRSAERIEALDPRISVARLGDEPLRPGELPRFRARADRLVATVEALVLDGAVRLDTRNTADAPWALTAERIELSGDVGGGGLRLEHLSADGGVTFLLGLRGAPLGDDVVARADAYRVTGSTVLGSIRLEGFPDGRRAHVSTPALVVEADWIEVDPELQLIRRSGPGRMLPTAKGPGGLPAWELRFSAAQSFEDHPTDSFLFALDQPVFESPAMEGLLRGTVALFWFDRVAWQDLPARIDAGGGPEEALRGEALRPADARPASSLPIASLTEVLRDRNLDGVLKEVYFEGPIEVLRGDQLVAHAEAIYADAINNTARMVNAQLNIFGRDVGQDFEKLIIRADSVRQTAAGVLLADRAQVTTSPFAEPNLVVETGDLRLVPATGVDDQEYQVYLRENRIHFRRFGLSLPLPPIGFGVDDELKPIWPTARFANSARFGTLLTLGFRRPLPKGIGDTVHDALGGDEDDPYDASFSADASYLSGRGALFDLGVDIEAAEDYELELVFGIVPDSGEDEGYIRVPEDERENPRLWFRAHSRFAFDTAEWLDVEGTYQTDASVQSEFWEDEFERYEHDESYAQWRKADDETYYQATTKAQFDSFRTTIEELPSIGAYFGRRPVLALGSTSLLWEADVEAAALRRRAGESGVQSPFSEAPPLDGADAFADGLGDRDVLRVDAGQRLEVPLSLGGLRATPFVDARFSGWDEGANPEASPTRFLARAGLRLSSQLWRRNSSGTFHQLVPFLEYANAVVEERVGTPVPFDAVERPIGGDQLDLGLRGRLAVAAGSSLFDWELRAQHRSDPPAGLRAGWQPLSVFARLDVEPLGMPVQLWHDARYDLSDGTTPYALSAVGVRASERLAFELGHRTGLDAAGQRLFEAAVLSAIYRWTPKWEFEGRQVYSLLNDNGLDAGLILRRYGTDLVFELEFEAREGEGTSVGISFRPRFGYNPSGIGTIGF